MNGLVATRCPVCAGRVAASLFDGGMQPLAALGWPKSMAEAQTMTRYPHDIVQCPSCTHVWNRSFRYEAVPYQSNLNRMFNRGDVWRGHLARTRDYLIAQLPNRPTVVDIGCGDGHFVQGVADALGGHGRFLGFDPNASAGQTGESGSGSDVEFHARLFTPLEDMAIFQPDAVVIRHLLEHLNDGATLLEELAWGAAALAKPVLLFVEVPCIDRVFTSNRLVDFFYEHVNHFTTMSFRVHMQHAGEVLEITHGYDGEVIDALVKLGVSAELRGRADETAAFLARSEQSRRTIRAQLAELAASGATVAIWGGTGKGAGFIHQYGVDAERFPLVVDSDEHKVGTYVPGAGQRIQLSDVLRGRVVDVLIIPGQWRAKDIVTEMAMKGIVAGRMLIEHNGALVDFNRDAHPYREVEHGENLTGGDVRENLSQKSHNYFTLRRPSGRG